MSIVLHNVRVSLSVSAQQTGVCNQGELEFLENNFRFSVQQMKQEAKN